MEQGARLGAKCLGAEFSSIFNCTQLVDNGSALHASPRAPAVRCRICCSHPACTPHPHSAPQSELESFLVEITASIFKKKDEMAEGWLIDKVLDKTGMKVRLGSDVRAG